MELLLEHLSTHQIERVMEAIRNNATYEQIMAWSLDQIDQNLIDMAMFLYPHKF